MDFPLAIMMLPVNVMKLKEGFSITCAVREGDMDNLYDLLGYTCACKSRSKFSVLL